MSEELSERNLEHIANDKALPIMKKCCFKDCYVYIFPEHPDIEVTILTEAVRHTLEINYRFSHTYCKKHFQEEMKALRQKRAYEKFLETSKKYFKI